MPETGTSPSPFPFDLSAYRSKYFENCTSYAYPSLRDWPSEILRGYGLRVFVLPLYVSFLLHIFLSGSLALALGKMPYTRKPRACARRGGKPATVYDQRTALREIGQCATTTTQTLSIATEWCPEFNIWKPRPPDVAFALVAYSLDYLIERYQVYIVGRLPETLWTDKDEVEEADAIAKSDSAVLEESSSRREVHAKAD